MAASKVFVVLVFVLILASLGSALFSLVKGKGTAKTFQALRIRVGLSVGLFVVLFGLFAAGVLQPHGGPG